MDLTDARVFIAVAEELHYGRAAERMSYSTASLSNRIRRFEKELGVELFDRTSRRVELTAAGKLLLQDARVLVHDVDVLFDHARALNRQIEPTLTIAYSPTGSADAVILVGALRSADVDRRVRLEPKLNSPQVIRTVRDGLAVAGVCRLASSHLESRPIGQPTPAVILAPRGHWLAEKSEVSISELDGEPLVVWQRESNPDHYDMVVSFFHSSGASPDLQPRDISSLAQLVDLVVAGEGIALVPVTCEHSPETTLVRLLGPVLPLEQNYLLWREDEDPAVVQALLGAADEVDRSLPLAG